jgi:hypothetical protein
MNTMTLVIEPRRTVKVLTQARGAILVSIQRRQSAAHFLSLEK